MWELRWMRYLSNVAITIILVTSVVSLGVAMDDAYAQSDHAIV